MNFTAYQKGFSKWDLLFVIAAILLITSLFFDLIPRLGTEAMAAIAGAAIGYLLPEVRAFICKKIRPGKLNHQICAELETLKLQLDYRKVFINKILVEPRTDILFSRLLPGSMTNTYKNQLAEIHDIFDIKQRTHLHMIYQWINIIDNEILNLDKLRHSEIVKDNYKSLIDKINFAEDLINDYLKGNIRAVFNPPE